MCLKYIEITRNLRFWFKLFTIVVLIRIDITLLYIFITSVLVLLTNISIVIVSVLVLLFLQYVQRGIRGPQMMALFEDRTFVYTHSAQVFLGSRPVTPSRGKNTVRILVLYMRTKKIIHNVFVLYV